MKTDSILTTRGPELGRRSLLVMGAAAAASLAAPLSAQAATPPIRYVLTDRRYAQSVAFGEALVRQGATRLELADGLTRIWQDVLQPHWRSQSGAVAGLTPAGAWFGRSEQARGEARRSALIGRHVVAEDSLAADHQLTAPSLALSTPPSAAMFANWPSAMAEVMSRCSSAPGRCDAEWRSEPQITAETPRHHLLSWIIA
jgi:hypothetical protein